MGRWGQVQKIRTTRKGVAEEPLPAITAFADADLAPADEAGRMAVSFSNGTALYLLHDRNAETGLTLAQLDAWLPPAPEPVAEPPVEAAAPVAEPDAVSVA